MKGSSRLYGVIVAIFRGEHGRSSPQSCGFLLEVVVVVVVVVVREGVGEKAGCSTSQHNQLGITKVGLALLISPATREDGE